MFFHQQSLTKGGPFYLCWLASCWPEKFSKLPKRSIIDAKLINVCHNMQLVFTNESQTPNKRFSLRLSSHLINGLVKLYRKKFVLLITDIIHLNASVSRNMAILQKIPNGRANKRKRQAPKHPERVIDQNCVVNISEITLQEPLTLFKSVLYDGFGDLPLQEQIVNVNNEISGYGLDITSAPLTDVNYFPSTTIDISNAGALPINDLRITAAVDAHTSEIRNTSKINTPQVPDIVTAEKVKKPQRVAKERVLEDIILDEVVPRPKKARITRKKVIRDIYTVIPEIEIKSNCINYIDQQCKTIAECVFQIPPFADVKMLFDNPSVLHKQNDRFFSRKLKEKFIRNALTKPEKLPFQISQQSQSQDVPQNDTVTAAPQPNDTFKAGFTPNNIAIGRSIKHCASTMSASTPQISIDKNESSLEPYLFDLSITDVVHDVQEATSIISASKVIEIHKNEQQNVVDASDFIINENIVAPSVDTISLNKSIEEYDEASLNRTAVMLRTPSPTDSTKEIRRNLNEDWEVEGVFKKILTCKNAGITPITIETLVFHEPKEYGRNAPSQRMMAAKAFSSLLGLKKHGFVEVTKKPNSCDIMDIKLTKKSSSNFDECNNE